MNRMKKVFAVATAATLIASVAWADAAKVKIDAGTLAGTIDDGVKVFKGVPFAAPPVGDLRWTAPRKPVPWKGER
ncbi:MAG TPA: carboxylesterase family protein, partial [Steroidobacteraceae bacterium]|nr:carboxylesterase family protein [Steroidobacteraceae bacterium]